MYKKLGIMLFLCSFAITIFIPIYKKESKENIKSNIYNLQYKFGNEYDKAISDTKLKINDKSNSDFEKSIYLFLELFYFYEKNEIETVINLSVNVENKLIQYRLEEELIFLYAIMINIYTGFENYSQAYGYIYKCEKITFKLYNEIKDEDRLTYLITIRYLRANISYQLGLVDEARRVFDEAELLRSEYKGKENADMYYNILIYQSSMKNRPLIEEYAIKTIDLIKDEKFRNKMYIDTCIILSSNYLATNDIGKSIDVLKSLSEENLNSYKDKFKLYMLYASIYEYYGKIEGEIKNLELAYNEVENTAMYNLKFLIVEKLIEAYEIAGNRSKVDEKNELYKDISKELINLNDLPYLLRQIIDTDLQYANYEIEFLEFDKIKLKYYIVLCILFIFSMIIISLQINKNRKILEYNISILNKQMHYQHRYYQNIKQNQFLTRIIWHDMKNHINVIDNLIKKKKYDKATKYICEIDNRISKLEDIKISNNSIINAILNNKIENCQKQGILIDYFIKIPSELGIDDFDLSVIFGNLLDNAIEACASLKGKNIEKKITIKSTIKGKYLYISIKNTKNTEVKFNKGKLISSKKDKLFHGIGLENVKRSVQKYNGEMQINYSENEFAVKILMNIQT